MQTCPGFLLKSLLESPGNLLEICLVKFVDTLIKVGQQLVWIWWHPAGLFVHLPLLSSPCTRKLRRFRQLVPLLTNKDRSLIMRGRLYNSCLRSSMFHGSETWPVRKENEVMKLQLCCNVGKLRLVYLLLASNSTVLISLWHGNTVH